MWTQCELLRHNNKGNAKYQQLVGVGIDMFSSEVRTYHSCSR